MHQVGRRGLPFSLSLGDPAASPAHPRGSVYGAHRRSLSRPAQDPVPEDRPLGLSSTAPAPALSAGSGSSTARASADPVLQPDVPLDDRIGSLLTHLEAIAEWIATDPRFAPPASAQASADLLNHLSSQLPATAAANEGLSRSMRSSLSGASTVKRSPPRKSSRNSTSQPGGAGPRRVSRMSEGTGLRARPVSLAAIGGLSGVNSTGGSLNVLLPGAPLAAGARGSGDGAESVVGTEGAGEAEEGPGAVTSRLRLKERSRRVERQAERGGVLTGEGVLAVNTRASRRIFGANSRANLMQAAQGGSPAAGGIRSGPGGGMMNGP